MSYKRDVATINKTTWLYVLGTYQNLILFDDMSVAFEMLSVGNKWNEVLNVPTSPIGITYQSLTERYNNDLFSIGSTI